MVCRTAAGGRGQGGVDPTVEEERGAGVEEERGAGVVEKERGVGMEERAPAWRRTRRTRRRACCGGWMQKRSGCQ
jgi:hypothetical protein